MYEYKVNRAENGLTLVLTGEVDVSNIRELRADEAVKCSLLEEHVVLDLTGLTHGGSLFIQWLVGGLRQRQQIFPETKLIILAKRAMCRNLALCQLDRYIDVRCPETAKQAA